MTWVLIAAVVVVFAVARLARRRRVISVSPSEPIPTTNSERLGRMTPEKRAALDAANQMLR